MANFYDVKKIDICFPFASYICWQEIFFKEYIEMELKIFFITVKTIFEWQK